jgi:hypothetical protein
LFAARVELWISEKRTAVREAVMAYMLMFGPAGGENNQVPVEPGLYWADRGSFLSVLRIFPSTVEALPVTFDEARSELANLISMVRELSANQVPSGVKVRLHLLKPELTGGGLVELGGWRGMTAFHFAPEGPIKLDLLAVERAVHRWSPEPTSL